MISSATLLLSFFISGCGIVAIFSIPFFGWILARHFDPYFPHFVKTKDKLETGFWIFNSIARGARYSGCMLMKNASSKWPYCQFFFNGFNFRTHAKKSDWAVVLTFYGSLIMILIFGAIIFVINGFHLPVVSQ